MEVFLIWLGLTCVAYFMYVVAVIYEDRWPSLTAFDRRHVPVWRHQSRAFLPGDAGLALFIAAAPKSFSLPYAVAGVAACFIALWSLRNVTYDRDGDDYDLAAWNSPSKRYHDYIVCFVFAFTATLWWLPALVSAVLWLLSVLRLPSISMPLVDVSTQALVLGLAGLAVWVIGLAWDGVKKQVPNPLQHPTEYDSFLWFKGSSARRNS